MKWNKRLVTRRSLVGILLQPHFLCYTVVCFISNLIDGEHMDLEVKRHDFVFLVWKTENASDMFDVKTTRCFHYCGIYPSFTLLACFTANVDRPWRSTCIPSPILNSKWAMGFNCSSKGYCIHMSKGDSPFPMHILFRRIWGFYY